MVPKHLFLIIMLCITCVFTQVVSAQNNLERSITLHIKQVKLTNLLTEIGKRGGFFFSYSSDMINTDSLVTLDVTDKTVRQLLDDLFHNSVAYKEAPGYIILRPAPNRLKLIPDIEDESESNSTISGYVLDDHTGAPVRYASVYENRLLVSTLTDERGFFKLKMKTQSGVTIIVSKELYRDTSINFLSNIQVSAKRKNYSYNADLGVHHLETSWLGKLLISSKLRLQSLNIGEFVSNVPVQTSLVPGWGNHGLMSGQIVNKFSLNALSGYSAGVDGLEIGGLYNLNKQDARYVQAAGLFNVVGGNFTGIQVAGLFNKVYYDVKGAQVAVLFNKSKGLTGLQIAGISNITNNTARGLQLAGIYNKAKILKGVHVALINIADTLQGAAINVLSFSRNGYKQVSVSTDENFITTLAYKSGNDMLYTKISGGVNLFEAERYFASGFALGHDFLLKKGLWLSTELHTQFLLSDSWNNTHQLYRINASLNIPVGKQLSFYFGPSFNLYDLGGNNTLVEQRALVRNRLALTSIGNSFKSWIGWNLGLTLF